MDSSTLFQKIFGFHLDGLEAREKLRNVKKSYPYFSAPYLFDFHPQFRNNELLVNPLFTPSPIGLHYAFKEEGNSISDFNLTTLPPHSSIHTIQNKEEESGKSMPITPISGKEQSIPGPNLGNPHLEKKESQSLPTFITQPNEKEELLFEPLHTTDYFASQGIRLSDEPKSEDRLGTQLRSFTQWLKTMKKLPGNPTKPGLMLDTPYDKQVENLAEKSNEEEEVITESMAEACLSQGKKLKAIEIYQKLSLQNPSKSAYFAAKIAGLSPGAELA